MFLDASAIIGIIALEDAAAGLAGRLSQARRPYTSAVALFEAMAGLACIANASAADALALVERFLSEIGATITPIDHTTAGVAVAAFDRFGKGRHPADLNMSDCVAYACARNLDVPLLCKGSDFPRTDLSRA
jgi:ribonuclease VapC